MTSMLTRTGEIGRPTSPFWPLNDKSARLLRLSATSLCTLQFAQGWASQIWTHACFSQYSIMTTSTTHSMTSDRAPLLARTSATDKTPSLPGADGRTQPPIADRIYRLLFGPPVCPPGIDPRPKFRPNGDRVFLMDQRGTTRSELGWTLATFPIHAIRQAALPSDPVLLLEQAVTLPDPTVIVPTLDIGTGVDLVDEPDPQVVSKRLNELRERRDRLAEENERWLKTTRSRKERLRQIDRRTLWTRDGRPVFLMARRECTWLESFLSLVTLPLMCWRSWKSFTGAMREADKEGKEPFDFADVPDPTVIVPTGKSFFLEEELSPVRPDADIKSTAGVETAMAAEKPGTVDHRSPPSATD